MKICPKCAAENADTAKYCNECGSMIVKDGQEQNYSLNEADDFGNEFVVVKKDDKNDQEQESTYHDEETLTESKIGKTIVLKKKLMITVAMAAVIIFCLIMSLSGHINRNKYYIKPRTDYTITDSSFDFLDKDTKIDIAKLLEVNIEWYNSIEYDKEKGSIPVEELDNDELRTLGSSLIQDERNKFNKKRLLATMPATKAYGDLSGYMVNNDRDINIPFGVTDEQSNDEQNNFSICITPEQWMQLHDDLQEAIDFYYGEGDHTSLDKEPETNYHVLTKEDDEDIRAEMVVHLLQDNPLLSNGDWNIDVNQGLDGSVLIEYTHGSTITKEEWLKESDIARKYTVRLGEVYVETFQPVLEKYDGYFTGIDLIVRINDSNDVPIVVVDKDKNIKYRADLNQTETTAEPSSVFKGNYTNDFFGNISFETPSDWEKEPMELDDDSKEYMRGEYIYSPTGDTEESLIYILFTDVDWSIGVKKTIDTGMRSYKERSSSSVETTIIDDVKAEYIEYQSEDEDGILYQKAYIFPCSETEVAMIILATREKDGSENLDHFIESIQFKKALPDNIKNY